MTEENEKITDSANREIFITWLFDAPGALVFDMWTDPVHIASWWAPTGFTTTITKMEPKPGGRWELVIHGPDGKDYKNRSVFEEIKKPQRIVFDHISGPKYRMTVEFEEQSGKTLLKIRMVFGSIRQKEEVVRHFNAEVGLRQNMEKLEEYLLQVFGRKSVE